MNFSISKFVEAEPGKPVTLRETHGPDYVHGIAIPFTMKVPPDFVARQAIMPTTADEKELTKKLVDLFFDAKKQVMPIRWDSIKMDVTYQKDFRYRMGISFANIDTENQAQYFTADKITIVSIKPLQGACFEMKFHAVIHPTSKADAGWLYISVSESKSCYLMFEQLQMDIEDETKADPKITQIGKAKSGRKSASE